MRNIKLVYDKIKQFYKYILFDKIIIIIKKLGNHIIKNLDKNQRTISTRNIICYLKNIVKIKFYQYCVSIY